MTCKKCFHYEACNKFAIHLGLPTTDQLGSHNYCGCYKNAAVVVEVVRCKDCERRNGFGCPAFCGGMNLDDEDFCSFGERRSEDADKARK
jgi:hypothetical protein